MHGKFFVNILAHGLVGVGGCIEGGFRGRVLGDLLVILWVCCKEVRITV